MVENPLGQYTLGPNHELIPCPDLHEWARMFGSMDRIVQQTGNRTVHVSTVFLGLDHNYCGGPPICFETMVFGGKHNDYQERYATWAEAERGHRRIVKRVFKHRPRRNARAQNGDFSTARKIASERVRRAGMMERASRFARENEVDTAIAMDHTPSSAPGLTITTLGFGDSLIRGLRLGA